MSNYPYEGINIENDNLILTKDFIEKQLNICLFASNRAKEQKDNESFTYFNGRVGVFRSLLEMWKYS